MQFGNSGRGERIRTSGLYVPNVALYQAKLHPACENAVRATLGNQYVRRAAKVDNCSRVDVAEDAGSGEIAAAAASLSRSARARAYDSAPVRSSASRTGAKSVRPPPLTA